MSIHDSETVRALPCANCGYDLRVHPRDGVCPECAAPVADAVARAEELRVTPVRPAWRDSDPRWRRRILAGLWVLASLPGVQFLLAWEPTAGLPVPGSSRWLPGGLTLGETHLRFSYFFPMFVVGTVLLFARERGRQPAWSDRVRPWGVFGCWAMVPLGWGQFAPVTHLVLMGIAALLFRLPPDDQPALTDLIAWAGVTGNTYGPWGDAGAWVAVVMFSSGLMLLACFPLYDALRSAGGRGGVAWVPFVLLLPLMLTAAWHFVRAAGNIPGVFTGWLQGDPDLSAAALSEGAVYAPFFFVPDLVLPGASPFWTRTLGVALAGVDLVPWIERLKWLAVLAVAVWLTAAQVLAWRAGPAGGGAHVGRRDGRGPSGR